MSDNSGANRRAVSANSLPQFMSEATHQVELEDKPSWLNNNLHKLMIGVSVVWFAIVLIYITQFFGWDNLFLMMPDEFGGFLAGITLPLAIIWVVMAYIDRGTSFKQEAKFLRAYMNQLVYPEDGAPQTAKAMADAIRSQVIELQQVSKMATEKTAQIKDEIRGNINEFSKLVATLDTYSSKTIVELSEGVKYLTQNFDVIVNKAKDSAETFSGLNREFTSGATDIENNLDSLFSKLLPKLKEIKTSAEILNNVSNASEVNISKANETLRKFNEQTGSNLQQMSEMLSRHSENLSQISEQAINNCGTLKKTVSSEIEKLNDTLEQQTVKLEQAISDSGHLMRGKVEELSKHAQANITEIHNHIAKGINSLDGELDRQVKKIDIALSKNNHEIVDLIATMNKEADGINKKLYSYGDTLAQEIDKLMVRGRNLEEGIAIQIGNLTNISDQAISSMQKVDKDLEDRVSMLQSQTGRSANELNEYIATIENQITSLNNLGNNIKEQNSDVTEMLKNRHLHLSETINDVIDRLNIANSEFAKTTTNLSQSSDNSLQAINTAADNMNRYANTLNETTAVVVAQSQISEASLAQQHKNITTSAARVEEIKSELRQQIDDLSSASSELQNDASIAVEKLKNNLSAMLASCNDVINKSRAINDNLIEQANMFDTSANRTLAKVTQFENVLTTQSQNIELLVQQTSDKVSEIDTILTRQTKNVDDCTSKSLSGFRKVSDYFISQSKSLHELSRNTAEYTSNLAQGFDEKAAALNILFKQQENEFYNFCDKISDNADKMSEALKQQVNIIEQSADKVFSRMVMLEEDTSRHTEAVVNSSHRSIERLAEVETLVGNKNELVKQMVDEFCNNIEDVSAKLQQHISEFSNGTKKITENSKIAMDDLNNKCSDLKNIGNDLSQTTSNIGKLLDENIKNIDLSLAKTGNQHQEISRMLENQANNLTDVANTLATQSRLAEASLSQQYKYLTDTVTNVSQKVKEINDNFKNNTDNIFDTTTKLAYEFDVLGDRLIKAGEDINKTSKTSMKSLDQVNLALSQHSEDLDVAVKHSVDKIGSVFGEYEKYIAGFNTVTAETSTGVIEINNLISAQRDKMVQISDDTKKLVECFNTVLSDTSNQLSDRANQAYDKVKGLGKDLKNLGLQMEEAAKISATHMLNSGDKLRASVAEIAANAERMSNDILNSGDVFLKQSTALVATTDDTISKVNKAMGTLLEASKDFSLSGDSIVKDALRFNDIIGNQIQELNEHTRKADTTLSNLTTAYQGIQIEGFLKQAGSIIEKLESLSVDINRVFNPKEEDDLWKKFYNGDTGVFVRYLSKNITKTQVAVVRKAFAENTDFRNQINAYLSEFELLINSAKTHEHSGLLLSVITGADIGKLYYVLAKIMDKLE
ncbi:MAG: hypothetical protein IJV97_00580 [Alphaproteobacteria bacterium]|nr:hypothetical protein [Alphaproteobacteria bacterium]